MIQYISYTIMCMLAINLRLYHVLDPRPPAAFSLESSNFIATNVRVWLEPGSLHPLSLLSGRYCVSGIIL